MRLLSVDCNDIKYKIQRRLIMLGGQIIDSAKEMQADSSFINIVRFMNLGTNSPNEQRSSSILLKARNSYFDRMHSNLKFESESTKRKTKTRRRGKFLEPDSCSETRSFSHSGSNSSASISSTFKIGQVTTTNKNNTPRKVRFNDSLLNTHIPHRQNISIETESTSGVKSNKKFCRQFNCQKC